jgi:predicted metal-dependent peptidase
MKKDNAETSLKKATIFLMRQKESALYSGVLLMGENKIVDDCPTACTDGVNKYYGRKYIESRPDTEVRATALHETLHCALNHPVRFKKQMKEDARLTNIAMDYVVNDIIVHLGVLHNDKPSVTIGEDWYYDSKYHNWSVNDVIKDLKKQQKHDPKKFETKYGKGSFDTHDFTKSMTPNEVKEHTKKIDAALREGSLLAGKQGVEIPRAITELLEPVIDWKDVLRDFVVSSIKGTDEYSWRKFNKRLMANELYLPSLENETMGELVVAIDTSGSIRQGDIDQFTSELVHICEVISPDMLRVIWWDYRVHGVQPFTDYTNLAGVLKPQGGGGTRVSCVSKYINQHNINADAVVVFTDGYVESNIEWNISTPTLWVITENKELEVPSGKKVKYESN